MPKLSKTKIENNTFVKGLITEAGPLTFPENASLVDENFVLNRDGSRQRRLGMSYENGFIKYSETSLENTTTATNSYTWKSVGNDGDLDIAVIQFGDKVYFFDNNKSPVSSNILNGGNAYIHGGASSSKLQFTTSYGKLVFVNGTELITVLVYDKALDLIKEDISPFRLKVRDLFGVQEPPDPLPLEDHQITISNEHYYNLRNQGWPTKAKIARSKSLSLDPILADPIVDVQFYLGYYPNNSDLFDYGEVSSASSITNIGAFSPFLFDNHIPTNTQVPKGRRIIDLFARGADRNLIYPGQKNDLSTGSISGVASYAGRLFYSVKVDSISDTDENSPDLSSIIYFSKSTTQSSELGKCYSENDPTDLKFPDILDTDGGFIVIAGVGSVYRLEALGESLFVFSSKGVWEINGGDKYFSATSQGITKTTDFGVIGGSSIVVGESSISFWSPGGIYSIQIDPRSLRGVPVNLTQNTIQSFYDDIPPGSRADIAGVFDDVTKQVRWLYRDVALPYNGYYNKELIYDLNLEAFYVNTFKSFPVTTGNSPFLIGYLDVSLKVFTDQQDNVVVGVGNNVEVLTNPVTVTSRVSDQNNEGSTKYWAVRDNGDGTLDFTVALYRELNFVDWVDEVDTAGVFGVDSEAILLTGFTTDGAAATSKKLGYFTLFMKRTESGFTDDGLGNLTAIGESSCRLRGQWEWTNSIAAGRWSEEREVYRLPRFYVPVDVNDPFDYSFTVVKTKNKIRGKGGALSLLFKSSPGKDLHIYGWSREVLVENS